MRAVLQLMFFGLLLVPAAAQAEYTRIDLSIFGMD